MNSRSQADSGVIEPGAVGHPSQPGVTRVI
jgi:hypothetical protein